MSRGLAGREASDDSEIIFSVTMCRKCSNSSSTQLTWIVGWRAMTGSTASQIALIMSSVPVFIQLRGFTAGRDLSPVRLACAPLLP